MTKKDVPKIKESELQIVLAMRDQIAEARKSVRTREGELAALEKDIVDRLRAGAEVASKKMRAHIENQEGAVRPAWKDEYLGHMETEHGMPKKTAEEEARGRYPAEIKEFLAIGFVGKP